MHCCILLLISRQIFRIFLCAKDDKNNQLKQYCYRINSRAGRRSHVWVFAYMQKTVRRMQYQMKALQSFYSICLLPIPNRFQIRRSAKVEIFTLCIKLSFPYGTCFSNIFLSNQISHVHQCSSLPTRVSRKNTGHSSRRRVPTGQSILAKDASLSSFVVDLSTTSTNAILKRIAVGKDVDLLVLLMYSSHPL